MGDTDVIGAIIGVFVVAVVAVVMIAVLDKLQPPTGALEETARQLRRDVASALVLAVGGVIALLGILIARLREGGR
jgi:heme/copper-type cytochrome/quinol oxidase subunit 2